MRLVQTELEKNRKLPDFMHFTQIKYVSQGYTKTYSVMGLKKGS